MTVNDPSGARPRPHLRSPGATPLAIPPSSAGWRPWPPHTACASNPCVRPRGRCELPSLPAHRRGQRPEPDRDGRTAAAGRRAALVHRRAGSAPPACTARACWPAISSAGSCCSPTWAYALPRCAARSLGRTGRRPDARRDPRPRAVAAARARRCAATITDALLERDLALFPEWCVQREFGVSWTDPQRETWSACASSSWPARRRRRAWPCTAIGCRAT